MSHIHSTACPLDCYDACHIVVEEGKLKGFKEGFTQGHLCQHIHHYDKYTPLKEAYVDKKEVSLERAVEAYIKKLKTTPPSKTLFFQGSGHVGKMQDVSRLFFNAHQAVVATGSLCDGAGQEGIKLGRGKNYMLTPDQIQKSELVVVWGRNIETTNTHMMKLLEGKKLIVIDPVETELAKKADLFIQIKPRGDFYLAMLLARFAMMEELEDHACIDEMCDNFEWYKEFNLTIRIKIAMQKSDIIPSQIYTMLSLIKAHKTAFLVGVGVQKYKIGESVLQAIDSLAMLLGKISKEGCGVGFLGDSSLGIEPLFEIKTKSVNRADIDFSSYDLVIFQGANALASLPNSARIEESLKGACVVYFGRDKNESFEQADIVIPAADFRCKNDIRYSYSDNTIKPMPKLFEPEFGISEYDMTQKLFEAFHYEGLERESYYLDALTQNSHTLPWGELELRHRPKIAYKEGFETQEEAFLFIEEYGDNFEMPHEEELFFITPKSKKGINTQFKREHAVYVHPDLGFKEGERVKVYSEIGAIELDVALDNRLRRDTVCIYSGTPHVNRLTPSTVSEYAKAACYQEITVKVERC